MTDTFDFPISGTSGGTITLDGIRNAVAELERNETPFPDLILRWEGGKVEVSAKGKTADQIADEVMAKVNEECQRNAVATRFLGNPIHPDELRELNEYLLRERNRRRRIMVERKQRRRIMVERKQRRERRTKRRAQKLARMRNR